MANKTYLVTVSKIAEVEVPLDLAREYALNNGLGVHEMTNEEIVERFLEEPDLDDDLIFDRFVSCVSELKE